MQGFTLKYDQPFKKFYATTTLNTIKMPVLSGFNVVFHCGNDDYIEIPGGSDTVPYTDDEGTTYEIPLDDLIDYDDEGEIQYTKDKKKANKYYMDSLNVREKLMMNFSRFRVR